jgi:hypothetical protein
VIGLHAVFQSVTLEVILRTVLGLDGSGELASPNPSLRGVSGGFPPTVDAWITTARCATKLPDNLGGKPVLALDHRLDVGELVRRLASGAGD